MTVVRDYCAMLGVNQYGKAETHLVRVVRRHSGDEVGVEDAALHQVHRPVPVPETVRVGEVFRPAQLGCPQHPVTGNPLVAEVVDREAHPLPPHVLLVLLV